MILQFDTTVVDEWKNLSTTNPYPTLEFPYRLQIFNKFLSLKKAYYIGSKGCNIISFDYEITEKGPLNASLKYMYLGVKIEYGDIVKITHNNIVEYIGYITNLPEDKEGSLKVNSLLNRLNELTFYGSFTGYTNKEILQGVLQSYESETNIKWNSNLVNLIETSVYSPNYQSISLKTIIEEWAQSEEDTFYGVSGEGFFYVKTRDSEISKIIYPGNYEKYKYSKDYNKIEYTRIDLYRNEEDISGNKQEVRVGLIPDGSEYPIFDEIETITGIKIKKTIAPDELSISESKLWAFGEVQAQILPVEQLSITGLTKEIKLIPGQKVRVFCESNYDFIQTIDTESLDNWTGSVGLSSDAYNGDYSILISGNAYYNFTNIQKYLDIKKIIFYAKSDTLGFNGRIFVMQDQLNNRITENNELRIIEDGDYRILEDNTPVLIGNVNIPNPSIWNYNELNFTTKIFNSLYFELTNVNIDYIHIYGIVKNYYDLNVKSVKVSLSKGNLDKYNVTLGSYDNSINNIQYSLQKELERRST